MIPATSTESPFIYIYLAENPAYVINFHFSYFDFSLVLFFCSIEISKHAQSFIMDWRLLIKLIFARISKMSQYNIGKIDISIMLFTQTGIKPLIMGKI